MLNLDEFLKYLLTCDGFILPTIGKRTHFTVSVDFETSDIYVIPVSTGKRRKLSKSHLKRVIDYFNDTRSLKRSDYNEITRSGSYVLALIRKYQKSKSHGHLIDKLALDSELLLAVRSALKLSPAEKEKRMSFFNSVPKKIEVQSSAFIRNPYVIAHVLKRAKGVCEHCKLLAPFTRKSDGSPYLEVHHTIPLADGGEDTVENTVAICPNCHRKAHFG